MKGRDFYFAALDFNFAALRGDALRLLRVEGLGVQALGAPEGGEQESCSRWIF